MFPLPLLLGTVALVSVVSTPLMIDLTVFPRATADHGGNVVVRGTVQCSIATTVSIEGEVVESLNRTGVAIGQFFTEVICDTTPALWTATVTPTTGVAFRPGFAIVGVRATGFDPENGIFAGVESLGTLQLTRSARDPR